LALGSRKKEEYLGRVAQTGRYPVEKNNLSIVFDGVYSETESAGSLTVSEVKEEIQREHLDRLGTLWLHCACVVMDICYFCETPPTYIEQLGTN
jgi:hypothetical protein